LFAVKVGAEATPLALVVAVAVSPPFVPPVKVPLAPVEGAVNVTVVPLTRFPSTSFTVAVRLAPKALLIVALCGVPEVAAMVAGAPALLVREKEAFVDTPVTEAVTLYAPATVLAVNAAAVATPLELVVAVTVVPLFVPPVNAPLAPLPGEVKVTVAPLTRFPLASFTVAARFVANAAPIVAL